MQQRDDVTFMMWFIGAVEEVIAEIRRCKGNRIIRPHPESEALMQLALQYMHYAGEVTHYSKVPGVGTQVAYNVYWRNEDDPT